jgi:alpha-glucosidase
VPLDFLETDTAYQATVYYDDPRLETRTGVGIRSQPVDSGTTLTVSLSSQGGQAIRIVPDE